MEQFSALFFYFSIIFYEEWNLSSVLDKTFNGSLSRLLNKRAEQAPLAHI